MLGVFALGFAKLAQFQLALHGFGFVAAVIDALAAGALHFYIGFLFCGHIDSSKRKTKSLK